MCLATLLAHAQSPTLLRKVQDDAHCRQWVDSVMQQLSLKERIGQLFIYTIDPVTTPANKNLLRKVVEQYKVGGLLFSGGTVANQAQMSNLAQEMSDLPLMITFDGEWGLAMRLKELPAFPKNEVLGRIKDNRLIYEYGKEVARQCREMGVQVNFAPVADVNINPNNPVINVRSFGDDPHNVAEKVIAYSQGLEDGGVLSVSKHFPGHGDTDVDSHLALPLLPFTRERLDSIELYPFRRAIEAGLGGVMVGHLEVPVLEPEKGVPSSLSRRVNRLLTEEMGFQGLVFTDALVMKGVTNTKQDVCLRALQAGNDLLLVPRRIKEEVDLILAAVKSGELSEELIDRKCRKVLTYKYALGLSRKPHIRLSGLTQRLHTPETADLIRRLKQAADVEKEQEEFRNATPLTAIDAIAKEGVEKGAYPGCRVVVWKEGKELYARSFGKHTYARDARPVSAESVYDLASLSKTTGTLLAVMKLYDKGMINLSDRLGDHLPFLKETDKAGITLRELLYHQSGLPSTIFFYQAAMDSASYEQPLFRYRRDAKRTKQVARNTWADPNFRFREGLTSPTPSEEYTMQVCEGLWLHRSFKQEYLQEIADAKLQSKRYRYSCVGFILLQQVVETRTGMSLDKYLAQEFYQPMGLKRTGYLPLRSLPKEEVVPSSTDDFLRKTTLQGYVHDESAAFQGGVSGNAGLFSTADEVARIYQMLLNGGELEGKRYLSESTCRLFTTSTSSISRRGLGFDKPDAKNPDKSPCSKNTPASVYGHTGFTGPCVWVDPDNRLIYVFLSNRTYPEAWNNKQFTLDIRTRIQEEIYKAVKGE